MSTSIDSQKINSDLICNKIQLNNTILFINFKFNLLFNKLNSNKSSHSAILFELNNFFKMFENQLELYFELGKKNFSQDNINLWNSMVNSNDIDEDTEYIIKGLTGIQNLSTHDISAINYNKSKLILLMKYHDKINIHDDNFINFLRLDVLSLLDIFQ